MVAIFRKTQWYLALALVLAVACGRKETGEKSAGVAPPPALPVLTAAPKSEEELKVVSSSPQGEVYGEVRPTVTFSRPVITLGSIEEEKALAAPARIEPPIDGQWRWLGSATVEFVPQKPFPYSSQFTVIVPAGLQALDGARLKEEHRFSFTTPTVTVQSLEPRENFTWVLAEQKFSVIMNQPVADFEKQVHLALKETGRRIPIKLLKEVNVAEERLQAEGRKVEDPLLPFKNLQTRYEFTATEKLALDTAFELVFPIGLRGKQGTLGTEGEVRYYYRTYGPMRIERVQACTYNNQSDYDCPWGPLVIYSTNRIDTATLLSRITIEPPVKLEKEAESFLPYDWSDEKLAYTVVRGAFRPGTTYQVRIAEGVKDEFGQTAPAFSGQIRTGELEPYFSLGDQEALLEAGLDGNLPVEAVNIKRIDFEIWKLDLAEMARRLGDKEYTYKIPPVSGGHKQVLDLPAEKNVPRTVPLNLKALLQPGERGGLFYVRGWAPEFNRGRPRQVFAQITDLAVHAKLAPVEGLVWVTSLSQGTPVAGAELQILDKDGRTLWTGKTDVDGLAKTPGVAELSPGSGGDGWNVPFLLVAASREGDTGITSSRWNEGLEPYSFGLNSDWENQQPRSRGLIFSERGIYRPGDKVYFKGLFRVQRLGKLALPQPQSAVTVMVSSSLGKEVFKRSYRLSRYGTFHGEFDLEKETPLGHYELKANLEVEGEELTIYDGFRVEEYRPPQFRVDVTAEKAHLSLGDKLVAQVGARYLFGGAMASARARWSVESCSTMFTPPGNEGFEFGVLTWWWDDEQPEGSCSTFASGEDYVDRQGNLKIETGAVEAPGGKTFTYTVEAEVEDVNRQRLANRAQVTVHPADYYAGVRPRQTGFAEAGKSCSFDFVAVTPDGKRHSGVGLEVEFLHREWKSVRKEGVGGRWFTVTEPVEEKVANCSVKSTPSAVSCEFTPEKPGMYVVAARATDDKKRTQVTRLPFFVVGPGWVSWQRNDAGRVDLVLDKQLYQPGENARVLIKNPYPRAEAVLTIEREGVLWSKRFQLEGAAQTVELPISEQMIPNAFVGAIIYRGRVGEKDGLEEGEDPGRPAVRLGYAQVKVEKKSKRLEVSLRPDAAEKRPRDKARLEVEVKDWEGKPTPAEVTLWAVDEGVLRLTNYQIPDPIARVFLEHGLSVRLGEPLLKLVLKRKYGEKGKEEGGGGGQDASGSGFRSKFKTTVLFVGSRETDAQGRASVEFELPDNLTTYRLMALAVTAGDRFGTGESQLVVSKPLLALPALPRFLRVGDTAEAGVVLHTKGISPQQLTVTAEVEGGLKLDEGDGRRASRQVPYTGTAQEVRFRLKAESPGPARLRFSASAGTERDGVEQIIPIQLPLELETVATYGQSEKSVTEGINPPAKVRTDSGGLELTLASSALGGFDENLRQLVDYPYGCLEQLSSRLIPLVALLDLAEIFGLKLEGPTREEKRELAERERFFRAWLGEESLRLHDATSFEDVARRTVRAIEALQRPDGGFSYWPGGECTSDFGSVYATLALGEARRLGFGVREEVFRRAQAFLAESVAAGRELCCYWFCSKPLDPTRVFALYVLERQGKPLPSYYPEMFGKRSQLPLFSQAMLTRLLYRANLTKEGKQLLTELMNFSKHTAAEVHFEEIHPETYAALWSSDTRTTAIALQALLAVEPGHPFIAKIARYLASVRRANGRFRNTQEAAFALMALVDLVRVQEKDVPDFTAQVTMGEKKLIEKRFKGRSTAIERFSLGMNELGTLSGKLPLVFQKDGSGILYYGARLRYAPLEMPLDPMDRGLVVQRWYEPWGSSGQATTFTAGDLVRVRVRVASSQERHNLVIEVPLPAGLEAVDTSLASTAKLDDRDSYRYESEEDQYGSEDEDFRYYFWSPFNHRELRDDRVLLFADHLPPGVHADYFAARATTPGRFLSKPARAEEMYAPEVFGRSEGGWFEVRLAPEVAGK